MVLQGGELGRRGGDAFAIALGGLGDGGSGRSDGLRGGGGGGGGSSGRRGRLWSSGAGASGGGGGLLGRLQEALPHHRRGQRSEKPPPPVWALSSGAGANLFSGSVLGPKGPEPTLT